MASVAQVENQRDRFKNQREELAHILASASFQRAPKLSRILAYICEKYFEGTAENLKEYSIAVEALDRAPGFDPHVDAIVRVDLHLLRKRLEDYYKGEGRSHRIRVVLPVGQYIPQFVYSECVENSRLAPEVEGVPSVPFPSAGGLIQESEVEEVTSRPRRAGFKTSRTSGVKLVPRIQASLLVVLLGAFCGIAGLMLGLSTVLTLSRNAKTAIRFTAHKPRPFQSAAGLVLQNFAFGGAPDLEADGIRILCGTDRGLVDSSGFRWQADQDFIGGAAFHRINQTIEGFPDHAIFENGRTGVFRYDIPVSRGIYEVHLYFAETQPGVLEGMRDTSFTVGEGETGTVDVVSDAGGPRIATMKIYADVRPGDDGKIHLNFRSSEGFLNAIEILPEPGGRPNPIRISTLSTLYTDLAGRHWLSDRFYYGGRNINHNFSINRQDPPLLSRERYGNFSYSIPVAKGYSYRLTLYMAERYWGTQNSGLGGTGSRIFDVYCNGLELLHNFDLLRTESKANAVAVGFENLHPDAAGKLKITFVPVVNYPLLNALEVEPE